MRVQGLSFWPLWVYRIIYRLAFWLIHVVKPLLPQKLQLGVDLRKSFSWQKMDPNQGPIVWVHCASGEFEYAKPVLRELQQLAPRIQLVVTFFSPSVRDSIAKFPGLRQFGPSPWDTPQHVQTFLKQVQPQICLIARTDLWPELLWQCKKNHIPTVLFAATQAPLKPLLKWVKSWLLRFVDYLWVVHEVDQHNLPEPHKTRARVLGDPRYDQVRHRLAQNASLSTWKLPDIPIFIAGSTWPDDEQVLLEALTELVKNTNICLVIAPHEPTPAHLHFLTRELQRRKISYELFSAIESRASVSPHQVLIVDRIGILADVYRWGQLAFVGGSMSRQVHSVMEPLAAGCLCFVGPHIQKNREAMEFQKIHVPHAAVTVVKDARALQTTIKHVLSEWPNISISIRLRAVVEHKSGASLRIAKTILEKITPPTPAPSEIGQTQCSNADFSPQMQ